MIAEEAAMGRQWRRMCRAEDEVAPAVDEVAFALSITAPKNEHEAVALSAEDAYDRICKLFPTMSLMRTCHMLTHGKGSVEQQHTLLCPSGEVAAGGCGGSDIRIYLLEYIDKRWWKLHTIVDREAQSLCLSGFVIWVLTYEYHLYFIEWTKIECIEYQPAWRIDGSCGIFLPDKLHKPFEVWLVEFALQVFLPRWVYLYLHQFFVLSEC